MSSDRQHIIHNRDLRGRWRCDRFVYRIDVEKISDSRANVALVRRIR